MLVVGLTGGIGSGKSTVSRRFQSHGVPVIDADVVSKIVSAPGSPGFKALVDHFGQTIVTPQGEIHRPLLREWIFHDPRAKQQLEAIIHPLIKQNMIEQMENLPQETPYTVLVIPLLVETGYLQERIHRILVVDIQEFLQYDRVMQRDRLTNEAVANIVATQAARQQRLAQADDVIRNNGDLSSLHQQVDQKHRYYLSLAKSQSTC